MNLIDVIASIMVSAIFVFVGVFLQMWLHKNRNKSRKNYIELEVSNLNFVNEKDYSVLRSAMSNYYDFLIDTLGIAEREVVIVERLGENSEHIDLEVLNKLSAGADRYYSEFEKKCLSKGLKYRRYIQSVYSPSDFSDLMTKGVNMPLVHEKFNHYRAIISNKEKALGLFRNSHLENSYMIIDNQILLSEKDFIKNGMFSYKLTVNKDKEDVAAKEIIRKIFKLIDDENVEWIQAPKLNPVTSSPKIPLATCAELNEEISEEIPPLVVEQKHDFPLVV